MNPRWRALKLARKSSPDGERAPIPWPYPLASSSSPAPSPFWTEVVSFFPRLYFSRFIFNLNANFVVNRPLRDGPNANWTVVVVKAVFRLGHLFFFFLLHWETDFSFPAICPLLPLLLFSTHHLLFPTHSNHTPHRQVFPHCDGCICCKFAVTSIENINQAFAVWAIA